MLDDETAETAAEVEAVLNYDPFEEGGAFASDTVTPAPEPTPTPAPDAPAAPEPVASAPVPTPAPAAPAQPRAEDDLRQTNESLRRALDSVMGAKPPANPAAPQEEALPAYGFNVRDEIINAMLSGDAAQMRSAVNAIAEGVARLTHQNLRTEYRAYVSDAVQRYVATHTENTARQQSVKTDFYGKYPQLDNEDLRPLVVSVASRVLKGSPGGAWTAEVRDKIGAEVLRVLTGVAPAGAPTPQPVAAPAPVAPVQQNGSGSGSGKRVGGPAQMVPRARPPQVRIPDTQAEMEDTLFG